MAKALLRQCFARNLRVIAMTFASANAVGVEERIVDEIAQEAGKTEGTDFAILGYQPNLFSCLITMSQDLFLSYPKDHKKRRCADLPVFKGLHSLKDMSLVIDLTASNTRSEEHTSELQSQR